jgi:tetratricopeptide (TPR) repeat protein
LESKHRLGAARTFRHPRLLGRDLTLNHVLPTTLSMAETTSFVPESPAEVWRRRFIWCFLLLLLVIASMWGLDHYRVWRYQHLLHYAAASAAKSDWEGVEFSLRQAMQIRPGDIEPYEKLADYAEKLEPSQAIQWRRSVAQHEPGYLRHRIAWAQTALKQGNVAQAAEALKGIDKSSSETAPVQSLIATISAAAGDLAGATKAAIEAVTLDPGNATNRFILARLQLAGTNAAIVDLARSQIEKVSAEPGFALEANRVLGMDALKRKDLKMARQRLEAALRDSGADLNDRLRILDLLTLEDSPQLSAQLATVQGTAGTNVAKVLAVAKWMNARGHASDGVQWLKGQPTNLLTHPLIRAARLEAYLAARQGADCANWLGSENWEGEDYLRLALLARVHFGMGQTNECDATWQKAVDKGRTTPRGRRALWQTAAEAGWREKVMKMLELSAEAPTDREWALGVLFDHYSRIPDTHKMLDISRRLLAVEPDDAMVRNNVAALSLLLKEDVDTGYKLARQAWTERPQDPAILATYGYALLLKGKAAEALDVFERIPPQYAAHPSIAVYYGAVLAANGQTKKAQPFLKVASTGHILPEEEKLLAETLRQTSLFNE